MMEPGLGAVIFLTFCIIAVFSLGAFLVYRVMTKPGAHIGSRLPKDDTDAEAAPTDPSDPDSESGQDSPDSPNDPDDQNGTDGPNLR